jgi:LuxR family maltose regulon positive regulatory protein
MLEERFPRESVCSTAITLVDRPRLLRRVQTVGTPVLMLNAPAGYGKSVLLSQWADLESRRVERIALTGEHNDPVLLVRSILAALDRIEPLPAEIRKPSARLIPHLGAALAERETPFVLMLDDVEEIESPDSLRAISTIGRLFPAGSQLALATRRDPGFPIGRLRAHRGLTELGAADLVMNKTECKELLAGLGVDPTHQQLDTLVRRTEGWPAALYLTGLALGEGTDLGKTIAEFAGDDRIVVDYIREELLGGLSRRRLDFLRRVSIVERLNGDLCDALLGRTGSATVLRDLSHSNMLLMPLDRRDEWFRLHPLLRDALGSELHHIEPELEPKLHRRASDWWAEHAGPDQAVDHAIEAGALDRAGELLWAVYREYSNRGGQASIKRWLDRIGIDGIASNPHLSLVAAYDAIARGAGGDADHWGAVSHQLSGHVGASDAEHDLAPALALLSACLARGGVAKMTQDAASAARGFGAASPWIATCLLYVGVGRHLQGRRNSARASLGEGARHAAVVSPTVQVLCLAQLALLAIEEDDWQSAELLALQARAQLERSAIGEYPMMALGVAVSALVSSHTGHLDRAAIDLRQALKLLERLEDGAAWYAIETRIVLARTAVRLDDAELASSVLDETRRLMRQLPDGGLLGEWIDQASKSQMKVSASGVTDLTPAELRVLQYMPTHLSIPEIAATIFVSSNTVKTQARGIYRKLGVSSRREAVDQASRLGLIKIPGIAREGPGPVVSPISEDATARSRN